MSQNNIQQPQLGHNTKGPPSPLQPQRASQRLSTPPPSANSDSPLLSKSTVPPSPAQSSNPSNTPPAVKVNAGKFPRSPTWPPNSRTINPDPSGFANHQTWHASASTAPAEDSCEPTLRSSLSKDPENDTRNTPSEAPWKYTGYRIFSRWMATDNAFLIVRRFGNLNARIALSMQDDIVQLEEQLNIIDGALCERNIDPKTNNGSFRNDPWADRTDIIKNQLPKKLAEYNSFINSYSQLLARPEIHKEDLTSVQNWLKFNKDAIYEPEREFIEYEEDLIGIRPKSRSCFRKVLEYSFLLRMPGLRRFFKRTPREYDLIKDNSGAYTTWQDDRKVEGCSSTLVAVIGLGMLVGPLWILAEVSNPMNRLGIITGFIALFFVLVKVATRARIFDALAAAAAYSAVLMVFLQAIAI